LIQFHLYFSVFHFIFLFFPYFISLYDTLSRLGSASLPELQWDTFCPLDASYISQSRYKSGIGIIPLCWVVIGSAAARAL